MGVLLYLLLYDAVNSWIPQRFTYNKLGGGGIGRNGGRVIEVLSAICLEGLKKTAKLPVSIASVLAQIQTEHIPNISFKCYR
jgi:hypothetical protein